MCSAPEFCRRNWALLAGKLGGTLYNLAKNVVVFGTKRRTLKNIYSKNLEHLLVIYIKDYKGSHFDCPFLLLCAQRNRSVI